MEIKIASINTSALSMQILALVQTKLSARFFAFRNFTMVQKKLKTRLQADKSLGISKHGRHN